MKKLLIVSLAVCMLGTSCSMDTNRIEENTLQQSQEQSVILQTETEEPTEASKERIDQLLKQAEADADQDRYYIVGAIDNGEASKRDTDAKLFIKEQYPDYFSSTELLEKGIQYGHYEDQVR